MGNIKKYILIHGLTTTRAVVQSLVNNSVAWLTKEAGAVGAFKGALPVILLKERGAAARAGSGSRAAFIQKRFL